MNLAQLRAFHAPWPSKARFSAAALALNVSQPAVTQHVRALEESDRRAAVPAGAAPASSSRPTANDLHLHATRSSRGSRMCRCASRAASSCGPATSPLAYAGAHVAMPLIRAVSRNPSGHPYRDAHEQAAARLLDMVAQVRVDLAIVTLKAPINDLVCHRLVDQNVLLVVPVDHPWASRDSVDLGELAGAALRAARARIDDAADRSSRRWRHARSRSAGSSCCRAAKR